MTEIPEKTMRLTIPTTETMTTPTTTATTTTASTYAQKLSKQGNITIRSIATTTFPTTTVTTTTANTVSFPVTTIITPIVTESVTEGSKQYRILPSIPVEIRNCKLFTVYS